MKPHIKKTCWGWAVYKSKEHSEKGLPLVTCSYFSGLVSKYKVYKYLQYDK